MNRFKQILQLTPLAALCAAALPALATNGYFPHGYGMKAKGMGGVSTALAQDSLGGSSNPAGMVWVGKRMDIGAEVFMPRRDAERSAAAIATLNGRVVSGSNSFVVPEFGYNTLRGDSLSLGVSVYGNGGMNTDYPQGSFNCGGGAANILCGSGRIGVNLVQLIVAPTVAYKLNPNHAVGMSLLLGYQRFRAEGLQAFDNAPGFPAFTSAPGSVTNKGNASSVGAGLRLGYQGRLSNMVTIGASYAPKMNMGKFDKYKGLFANQGEFDIPAHYSVGVAVMPTPDWTIAVDLSRTLYSGVAAVSNSSAAPAPLGAANGPGFGWHDVQVLKVGAAWKASDTWTLRAGYNRGDNPIRPSDVSFNILAPGVVKSHYTAGFTYAMGPAGELTAALMVAPRVAVSGPSLFNSPAIIAPGGLGGNETIGMRQTAFGLSWGKTY